jgi:hypothetical protein
VGHIRFPPRQQLIQSSPRRSHVVHHAPGSRGRRRLRAGRRSGARQLQTSSAGAIKAKTSLTKKIATETPLIRLGYTLNQGVDLGLGANAVVSDDATLIVGRIHADSAQLEWVLGADVQRRADNTIAYGQHEQVYNHPARGDRAVDEGLAYLRLSNYFIANADSLLGVPHPKYTAEPYQPYKNRPVKITTPLIAKAPKPTLAAIISMGTPLLQQTIPDHIFSTFVRLNQAATNYYSKAKCSHTPRKLRPTNFPGRWDATLPEYRIGIGAG